MISMAAMRPAPDSRGSGAANQRADVERQVHEQLLAPLLGEEVDDAVERLVGAVAWSVASTRWPVSANWMPYSMVSRSRISPIRITSGACRRYS